MSSAYKIILIVNAIETCNLSRKAKVSAKVLVAHRESFCVFPPKKQEKNAQSKSGTKLIIEVFKVFPSCSLARWAGN